MSSRPLGVPFGPLAPYHAARGVELVTSIKCSSCWQEVSFDGDWFVCSECGLSWPDTDEPAEYLDESASVCGKPCGFHPAPEPPRKTAGDIWFVVDPMGCPLLSGHTSGHACECESRLVPAPTTTE